MRCPLTKSQRNVRIGLPFFFLLIMVNSVRSQFWLFFLFPSLGASNSLSPLSPLSPLLFRLPSLYASNASSPLLLTIDSKNRNVEVFGGIKRAIMKKWKDEERISESVFKWERAWSDIWVSRSQQKKTGEITCVNFRINRERYVS